MAKLAKDSFSVSKTWMVPPSKKDPAGERRAVSFQWPVSGRDEGPTCAALGGSRAPNCWSGTCSSHRGQGLRRAGVRCGNCGGRADRGCRVWRGREAGAVYVALLIVSRDKSKANNIAGCATSVVATNLLGHSYNS
jgi:hypothetical protein